VYSQRLLELFNYPAHAGRLEDATHFGEAGTPGHGPFMRLWLRVEDGIVVKARFKTYGCPAAIACGEAACDWSEGRTLAELAAVTPDQVRAWVDGVPESKTHCPPLAAEGLHRCAGCMRG
jgi:nitrogen fixation protein NifU and related proteins